MLRKEQQAQGVPPNWMIYVAVTSADAPWFTMLVIAIDVAWSAAVKVHGFVTMFATSRHLPKLERFLAARSGQSD